MSNGIKVNAGFDVGSANPIDSRMILTTTEMLNADVNIIPNGQLSVNSEDHFLYIFNPNGTYSETTGYFKKYTSDGGKSQWYGEESEYQELPIATQTDTSIVFYRYGSDSEKNYVVSDHSIKQEVYMSESAYQELETKDSDTIYLTPGHIRKGEDSIIDVTIPSMAATGSDITELLKAGGLIILGPGTYYVSEPVTLPQKTIIRGYSQELTVIKPTNSSTLSNAQSLLNFGHYCEMSNVRVEGYGETYVEDNPANLEKNAIRTVGIYVKLDNIWVTNWEGVAFYITASISGTQRIYAVRMTDCTAQCCKCGYLMEGEYSFINGCIARGCTYGLCNVSGNNLITCCHFDKNEVGVRISGRTWQGQLYGNNGHTTISACTFNHCGKLKSENTGWGCYVNDVTVGVTFVGCQWFYGKLEVVRSQGVWFNSCEFGSGTLTTSDNTGLVMFKDCNIHVAPTVQNTDAHRISEGNRLVDGTIWDATVATV